MLSNSALAMSSKQLSFLTGLLLAVAIGASANATSRTFEPATFSSPAGQTLLTRDEALALAFPKCEVTRSTVYLEESQQKRIASLAKVEFKSAVLYPYRATLKGKHVGTAYFDTHRVRSLRETLMIVVKPDGTIGRVEVLSFAEPKDYLPRAKWYAQFPGRKLDSDLNLGRKIRGVTGATLTSSATTKATRRVLALDQVLKEIEKAELKKQREAKRKGKPKASA